MESKNSNAKGFIFYLKKLVFTLIVVVVIFELLTYFLSMALGFATYFFTPSGLSTSKQSIERLPIYIFFLFNVVIPLPINIGDLFLSLWIMYIVCLATTLLGPKLNFIEALKKPSNSIFSNSLFALTLLANAAFFLTIAIQTLQETQGIPTGNPFASQTNSYLLFLILAYAPIVEELGFRIIPLGFMFLIFFRTILKSREDASLKKKSLFLSFLYPEYVKEELKLKTFKRNGIKAITDTEWIAVFITAVAFGLAHYLAGWEVGKITSTFVVGLILSISYIIYGICAPILIHWFLNFYWEALSLGADLQPTLLTPFVDFMYYFSIAVGSVFCAYILTRALQRPLEKIILPKDSQVESAGPTNENLS